MPVPLLLDTDIGTDVDDELALALLVASPEVALRGVCTTYGDVALRAAIVVEMLRHLRRAPEPVPVERGRAETRSGRPVWWAGNEGRAYGPLRYRPSSEGAWVRPSPGAALLANADGDHVLAIGPLGSLADALDLDGGGIVGLTLMGGDWSDPGVGEHNLASDSVSARAVLTAGLPTTVVGVDVTRRVRFDEAEVARFAACGYLGAVLAVEMHAWRRRWDEDFEVPHDPLAALTLIEPDLFTFAEPCAVEVSDGADGAFGPEGAVRRTGEAGTVRVVTDVDVEAARRSMADRIARALGEPAP
ncbi:nucleoside hydrolase [Amnibacterium endophyticum]|uniref:Nucleoside hydrolase n=1 Tax=Amnibacterium endophyticum TaxID=2109337 RepID=A0ABW4L9V5_9MICO